MHGRKILHYDKYSKYPLREEDSLCASKSYNRRKGPKGCFRHQWEDTPRGRCHRDFLHSPPNSVALSFLYLLDSDCLTSLLVYSQSFLDLSSFCQLFPFFFSLCLIFSSSCFLHLSSFLFSLSCNFFCFSASCLAFFSFSSSKICIDSGPLTKFGILF